MEIVTGDHYLEHLVRFVDRNAGPLLEGTITLKLNPVGLHYVQSRLEALRELEALLAGAPVDYLRAYVADLGDHRALEQLRRIIRLLTSLKVFSVLPPPTRDPSPVALWPFERLKVLELRGCDLSTSEARGLLDLRHTLEKLICHNSTDALRHVFASRIVDIKDSPEWKRLSFVSCACNGLVLMDESLQLLPAVETLDLSRNRFEKVDNLQRCMKLQHLDLGFNHLRSVALLSEVPCQITKLVLRNNALTTLRGIEKLRSLVGLDVSYNIISNFSELEILAGLSSLQSLWLEGNPICCARWHRAHIFSLLHDPEKLKLDGKGIQTGEYWERHLILASGHKQPAGYGFYLPPKDDSECESSLSTKKKKNSRTACIEEEQKRLLCEEIADQDLIPYDGENLRKEENAIFDNDSKIVSLINKAEFLKKERPVLWLLEFKEWMDQTTEDTTIDETKCLDSNFSLRKGNYNSLRESSKNDLNSAKALEGISSSSILQSNIPYSDGTLTEAYGGRSLAKSLNGLRVEQDPSMVTLNQPGNRTHSQQRSLTVEDGDGRNLKTNSASSNAINEKIESWTSFSNPGSPPQYREDILHRRIYIEGESLQLSADSTSVCLSDGAGSSSDDGSSEMLYFSDSGDDSLVTKTNGNACSSRVDACFEQNGEQECMKEEKKASDFSDEQDPDNYGCLSTENDKEAVLHDSLDGNGLGSDSLGQDTDTSDAARCKGKQKVKRRVISHSDSRNGAKPGFVKANGNLKVDKNVKQGRYVQVAM